MLSLRPHQQKVIEYITNTCSNQRGLLLYHRMGTGKTMTTISFCMNYPNPVLIICPKGVVPVWYEEMNKLGLLKTDMKRFHVISFDKLTRYRRIRLKIEDTILVIDEGHRLIPLFNTMEPTLTVPLINWLKSSYKCLMLTGTPIYLDESDISYLINIVAGKDLLPYIQRELLDKYGKFYMKNVIIYGWGKQTLEIGRAHV